MNVAWAAFAAAASIAAAQPEVPGQVRYAVIVANGRSLNPRLPALEFADDDAVRYAEMFSLYADDIELLAVLDPELQRSSAALAARAMPPDRAHLLDTLDRVFAQIRRDRAAGLEVTFYFVLVGHGEIGPSGEGKVSLLDAPFTRSDLVEKVLRASPANRNHLIIDACNSYFMVHRRGDDAKARPKAALGRYLERGDLAPFPNTGALLSTSRAKDSHEWARWRAGVFSHQLRSALSGAADADGDGRVDYSEIHAFIAAANAKVEDPRAKLEIFVAPPAIDLGEAVIDLRQAKRADFLTLPGGAQFRGYLEDERGVRYADLHTSGEVPVHLALVPQGHYLLRTHQGRELWIPLDNHHVLARLDRLAESGLASRGGVGEELERDLFGEAFGPSFYRGFAIAHGYPPPRAGARWSPQLPPALIDDADNQATWAWVALGAGAALAGGAIAAGAASSDQERGLTVVRNGLSVGAAAALITGALLLATDSLAP